MSNFSSLMCMTCSDDFGLEKDKRIVTKFLKLIERRLWLRSPLMTNVIRSTEKMWTKTRRTTVFVEWESVLSFYPERKGVQRTHILHEYVDQEYDVTLFWQKTHGLRHKSLCNRDRNSWLFSWWCAHVTRVSKLELQTSFSVSKMKGSLRRLRRNKESLNQSFRKKNIPGVNYSGLS